MVFDMVLPITSLRLLWRALLSLLSRPATGGFLVQLLHLIPTSMIGQTSARVLDCGGSHVKRALTCSATVHEVRVGTAVAADPSDVR